MCQQDMETALHMVIAADRKGYTVRFLHNMQAVLNYGRVYNMIITTKN